MTDLVVTALAVLWAWEFLLVAVPFRLPAVVQPLLVAALAYGCSYVPDQFLIAGAIAGVVAILHVFLRAMAESEAPPVQIRRLIGRNGSVETPGVPSRIPDLP